MTGDLQTKTKKRRPIKKRSPLSPVKKQVARQAQNKKPLKKVLSKKSNTKKKRNVKAVQQPLISLPLGRGKTLVLSLHRSKTPARKQKKYRAKKKELITPGLFVLGGLLGMVFFGMQVVASSPRPLAVSKVINQNAVAAPVINEFVARSVPTVLRIPAIELESPLLNVGMGADGSIEVPKDYAKAGWYRLSPTPGEKGPSVIVGHLDNIHGQAVFWRLSELTPGQIIEITREDGKTIKFVVTQVKQYPQDSFPTDEVFGNIDHSGLRLITCGGIFNYVTQHYSDNTVVFASLMA